MDKLLKKRVTISLDPALYRRLDKRNRSANIEHILTQHFQYENKEKLYEFIKERLIKDGLVGLKTLGEIQAQTQRTYHACCPRYPDLNCGHWIKNSEDDTVINKKTGEVRELG